MTDLGTISAIAPYAGSLASLIKSFKYGRARHASLLGQLVVNWLEANAEVVERCDVIVANPAVADEVRPIKHIESILSVVHSLDVARRWRVYPDALVKRLRTPTSAGHDWATRLRAAERHADAVTLAGDLRGARVLLFDDVLTTGAQLNAVARRLRRAGARRVDGLVIARAQLVVRCDGRCVKSRLSHCTWYSR